MTKKVLALALACMMVFSVAVFTVSAEENVYYVEYGASGDGSKDDPFGTIEEAILALEGEDGTVYVIGSYDMTGWQTADPWEGMVTLAGFDENSVLTLADGKSAVFFGDITIKNIKTEVGKNTHFNPQGTKFVWDAGEGNNFEWFFHLGMYGSTIVEEGNFIMESGSVKTLYAAGGYNTSLANGIVGDDNVIINGGNVTTLFVRADAYKEDQTGISIGGNLNIIINGGNVAKIKTAEKTAPEIMGAQNYIFNNGTSVEDFNYDDTIAAGGTYVIHSAKGGMVTPTADPGVFNVKADAGKVAKINGKEVFDGTVELEPGETEVKWVKGEQPIEITLVIDKAEIVTNGVATALDVPAQIINDRTMVPLRAIFEALGASVEWNNDTRTVTSKKGDTEISLTIDDTNLYVNGEAKVLDVPAQIVNDRTMVPARAIAEAYGCDVQWNGETRTVTITK